MKAGRPRKYKSGRALMSAVERYFRSISRTVKASEESGRTILNDDGKPIEIIEYVRPPCISGLCLYLGIDRSTWSNYKADPEYGEAYALARERVEAYLEEQLLTRRKGIQGIIFNLQNNYGWRQRQDITSGDSKLDVNIEIIKPGGQEDAKNEA